MIDIYRGFNITARIITNTDGTGSIESMFNVNNFRVLGFQDGPVSTRVHRFGNSFSYQNENYRSVTFNMSHRNTRSHQIYDNTFHPETRSLPLSLSQ